MGSTMPPPPIAYYIMVRASSRVTFRLSWSCQANTQSKQSMIYFIHTLYLTDCSSNNNSSQIQNHLLLTISCLELSPAFAFFNFWAFFHSSCSQTSIFVSILRLTNTCPTWAEWPVNPQAQTSEVGALFLFCTLRGYLDIGLTPSWDF